MLSNSKPSAIFRLRQQQQQAQTLQNNSMVGKDPESMMDDSLQNLSAESTSITLGISIEPEQAVQNQVAASKIATNTSITTTNTPGAIISLANVNNTAYSQDSAVPQINPIVLAQRILKHMLNFVNSYATVLPAGVGGNNRGGSIAYIPLKAFEDWYKRFENRVATDSSFLKHDTD